MEFLFQISLYSKGKSLKKKGRMTRWHYAENLALKVEIVFFCESISLGGKNQNGLKKGFCRPPLLTGESDIIRVINGDP